MKHGLTNPERQRRVDRRAPKQLLDRFALYELCAQNPLRDARVLRAIYAHHAGFSRTNPVLAEDFCGTAALSRAWCGLLPDARAVAIDHDPRVLARARRHPRLRIVRSDVMRARARVDLIAVLNFSICERLTRPALLAYLRSARARLHPRGSLVCDLYGGADAFLTGTVWQTFRPPGSPGTRIRYGWEQRTADPLTGRVVNAMHFRVHPPPPPTPPTPPTPTRGRPMRIDDAFVYDWRLWSIPELREAMLEAGFSAAEVFPRTPDALDNRGEFHFAPVDDPAELGDSFTVYVVGRI